MLTGIAMYKHRLEHNGDGPLDPFILISRACEASSQAAHEHGSNVVANEQAVEEIANALYLALRDRGWCVSAVGDGGH